jgi:hypothetical protein
VKARYSYPLLFLLPSAMVAFLAAFVVAGVGAGILWIFVYGDRPWPESVNTMLMGVAIAGSALTLTALVALSYFIGKSGESRGGVPRSHVVVALVISVGLPLLVLLHQWQVGNIGGTPVPANNSSKPTPLRGAA